MTNTVLERFFGDFHDYCNSSEFLFSLEESSSPSSILLIGPPHCGKRSLLFSYALNTAAHLHNDERVVFLCSKKRWQNSLPPRHCNGKRIQIEDLALKYIKIKYVDDGASLRRYFANLHLLSHLPQLIIIDDLSGILSQSNASPNLCELGKTLSYIKDGIRFVNFSLQKSAPIYSNRPLCEMLLSESISGELHWHTVEFYRRWISDVFLIEGEGESFTLSMWNHTNRTNKFQAGFLLVADSFFLKSITFQIPPSDEK